MCKIIYKGRNTGKTTELIKLASTHQAYIVCHSIQCANGILKQARDMGLNIPMPITYDNFIDKKYYGEGIKGFLIDNAEHLLQRMTKVPIMAITINKE